MTIEAFENWLSEHSDSPWKWYVKRLAANDTLATGANQAGFYLPKDVAFDLFPALRRPQANNPRQAISASIDSHGTPERVVNIIWYNQRSRNECRITGWGGSQSPLLDPDATGSIVIFAFRKEAAHNASECHVWICDFSAEELFELRHGPVEPGTPSYLAGGQRQLFAAEDSPCRLTRETMPSAWLDNFPSGADIVRYIVNLRRLQGASADVRLLKRRDCEFEIFRSIEQHHVMPRLSQGFASVDQFIDFGNAVSNRRKSRSGRSLELHVAEILSEENIPFSHGEFSEGNKRPEFLIPSAKAYQAGTPPLWLLAAKTTCKDRWRQILSEADKIPEKHLITLQEGISENQFTEMRGAGVSLVVPASLHKFYPAPIRPNLLSLEQFIGLVGTGLVGA